ncbi:MAG TPA: NADP-dependent oxidoreductase [Solirubrobacteraceae bacterium]|jgi:NADPH2:quinone reductase|nr:NADP-dependent oxidoreductase [Solirubrobacteraceae bacterium]
MSSATATVNRAYRLRQRPAGEPNAADLELVSEEVAPLAGGQALIRTLYLSVDPTNRLWMSDMRQYSPPVELGAVMRGIGIGEVVESRRGDLPVGTLVSGYTDWQEYRISGLDDDRPLMPLPDPLIAPLTAYLGVLGHTGLTAYIGLELIGGVPAGETVVVSAACGAVGSVVGQIATARDARAVGIAGGVEKCRHLVEELGFDAAVDRRAPDWREQLVAATPDGIDIDFQNVGGQIMDEILMRMNFRGRVVLCGMISQYDNAGRQWDGQRNIGQILMQRLTVRGFIVSDETQLFEPGAEYLAGLVASGQLRHEETIVDGLENALDALHGMFTGSNTGKLLVKVADRQVGG